MSTVTLKHFTNAAVVAVLAVAVIGCRKKTDTSDAGASDATASAVDAAPAPEASNESDITRFPDETKLDHVAATTLANVANVRKSPPNGAVVTTLPKGTNVTEIAQKDRFFLVTFDDPKDATKKLEGWIVQDAFTATPTHKKPTVTNPCPTGQQLLLAEQDFCGHVCTTDKECPAGQACVGKANLFALDGKVGEAVSTCSFRFDAGAPVVAIADAGAVAKADAATPAPVPGQTVAGIQQPPDAAGKCPAAFTLADDKLCHHACTANKDCGTGGHCTKKHSSSGASLCFTTP